MGPSRRVSPTAMLASDGWNPDSIRGLHVEGSSTAPGSFGHPTSTWMMARMSGMKTALWAAVIAAVIGAGAGAVYARTSDPTDRPAVGGMPADVDGDGLLSDSGVERVPELIKAVGDNGIEGYVRLSDLDGPVPANPDEAVAVNDAVRVIPVYAEMTSRSLTT